jgi:hypothetical protein
VIFSLVNVTPKPKVSPVHDIQKGKSNQFQAQSSNQLGEPRSGTNRAGGSYCGNQDDRSPQGGTPVLSHPISLHHDTRGEDPIPEFQARSPANSLDPRSYDKRRQSFKCPRFSGQAREWKAWDKGFLRYLSIWELDYLLNPEFYDMLPLSPDQRRDNKLVYYVIKDAVPASLVGRGIGRRRQCGASSSKVIGSRTG